MADAARHLFTACGFQNTRMAQISAAAGIKVGQIYRDFDSKEAIVAEIVAADIAEFLNEETLERAIESRDPVALRHWITNFICDSDPDEGRLLAQIIVEATRNEPTFPK
ncbi:TetR/AcrR family transcriptional regulator [Sphingomonas sp.]|uniref:TetR/AcrR family transcriptional regulator n=1 Tax=Sphingomonas sp. TaxID=28214 RepID=UPI0025F9DB0D|nr:TetR/AcrR family transcriptional regulator [Sphingomonas sp.]